MYFHITKLIKDEKQTKELLTQTIKTILTKYAKVYNKFLGKEESVIQTLREEIQQFQKTLSNGQKKLEQIIEKTKKGKKKTIEGSDLFLLYDTFGFPIDLSRELAENNDLTIDEIAFEEEMSKAKKRSKQSASNKFNKDIDRASHLQGVSPTEFIGYDRLEYENPLLIKQLFIDDQHIMIFDKTPFYAE